MFEDWMLNTEIVVTQCENAYAQTKALVPVSQCCERENGKQYLED